MTNPFEREDAIYLALRNDEGQYSIWPADIPAPAGWHAVLAQASRQACLDFVEGHWTDLRPASLVRAMRDHDAAATK
jgi:MbtH protein